MIDKFRVDAQLVTTAVLQLLNTDKRLNEVSSASVVLGVIAVAGGLIISIIRAMESEEDRKVSREYFIHALRETTNRVEEELLHERTKES